MVLDNKKEVLNSCRYSGDENLHKELLEDKKIRESAENLSGQFRTTSNSLVYKLLGNSLKINKNSAPNIFAIFEECQDILNLKEYTLNAFINSSQELQASCVFDGKEITIELNSGIIKALTHEELKFVIGHELGHALFNHHSLPAYGIYQSINLAPSKVLKLMSWSRQSEISADRVGLLCCGNIEAASKALIKLSCGGLDEEHISFDPDDFQKQIIDRKGVNTDEIYFTHPLSPLRVRAIFDFWKSEAMAKISKVSKKDLISNNQVDENISKFLEKMNPKLKSKKEVKNKGDFILHSAYYVLIQDNVSDENKSLKIDKEDSSYYAELKSLKDLCGEDEVDNFLQNINKLNLTNLKNKVKKLSIDFKKSKKGVKCAALEKIITIARADGELSSKEKKALYFVTSLIDMKKDFVDQILKFLE